MNKNQITEQIYMPTLEVLYSGLSDKIYYGLLFDGTKIEVTSADSMKEVEFTPIYTRKHADALMNYLFNNQEKLLQAIPKRRENIRYVEAVVEFAYASKTIREVYRLRIMQNADNALT